MKEVLQFLSGLKENNHKEWFDTNRKAYENSKKKVLFLTELLNNEIRKFDADIPVVPAKDCLFRIFRDVRFSNNKSPYKTNMGSFIARGGRKSERAGYYVHIEPGNSFIGGGVWCPQPGPLKAIRTEIADHANEFAEMIGSPGFKKYFPSIEGEKLKTAPKGYAKDHEAIDLLVYKSYAFGYQVSDELLLSSEFVGMVVDAFQELSPVNRFLNGALDKWLE